ncbi:MAG: aldo/keto reductase [Verrucomicrobiota bacterium]
MGTAQLGMAYGVANLAGRPSAAQASALIATCVARGITWFDTAEAYGDSELVLGQAFADLGIGDRINAVSKGSLPAAADESLTDKIHRSLRRLGLSRLACWLMHDEHQLAAWTDEIARESNDLRDQHLVGSFGLSVYSPEVALRGVEEQRLSAVQFPASPLDRRFLRNRVAVRLAGAGARLFVRSVFLQGLCLMAPAKVPPGISRGKEAVGALAGFCESRGLRRDAFCLHYVLHRTAPTGAQLVFGVDCAAQLERNLHLLNEPPPAPACFDEWDDLWPADIPDLILPYRWPRNPPLTQ